MLFHLDALSQSPLFPPTNAPITLLKALTYAYCYAYMCFLTFTSLQPPSSPFTPFTAFYFRLSTFHLTRYPLPIHATLVAPALCWTINTHVLLISCPLLTETTTPVGIQFMAFLSCTFQSGFVACSRPTMPHNIF